ncbi:DNA methyltransferase [Propionivibrio sp.]|uniref:class I SAM-dependent DNA methyltransferase n=1 Tax=Propionivibrio sp. TaxID=2212460 RepID=UPI0025DE5A30|nr:DNA methyltransferase [Propionivibrio sp.]MBK8745849.1 class I SAM-dependent DNA methyltransferase [Propionivibrio sp.]
MTEHDPDTLPNLAHGLAPSLSLDTFLARWQDADGSELANYQLFVTDLCRVLGVPSPDPAREDTRDNAYVFERRITFRHGDGSTSIGRIDCYRRGAYVLEAKKIKLGVTSKGFDDALQRARGQAESYARALPTGEGRPPFLIVIDVGRVIELYADFTCSGATYTPFPDPRSHRIKLAELCDPANDALRERLKTLWLDPLALDPSRASAKVTRDIAVHLARIARTLEDAGHHPELVAGFLTRCLFSMFAEDVGLLPKQNGQGAFRTLLETLQDNPQQFVPLLAALWREMDSGGFSVVLREMLPRFNGKLFKHPEVLALDREQIGLLIEAASADWTQVEPAIFGTLLERALTPSERHALGAHYTPRAYVERLVLPTIIEPLREQWRNVQAAALLLANEGKLNAAQAEVDAFHHRLCQIRVLDPACGSANFLYVTLEHMKRLEGEVLDQLNAFGRSFVGAQQRLEAEGLSVDPHQFLGLELNPRAAAIAELVLWIGYLQWHFRTRGSGLPPQPILKDFKNVECRDAVLAWDAVETVRDERGIPISRWDGVTTKTHPVTGEAVPDENARKPLERYLNPRKATWPQADYIVGNPPFIGASSLRAALGDGYVEALRKTWPEVPESADLVMFWWHHAAQLVAQGEVRRFGLITTNSLKQTFNRRVVQSALDKGVALAFAIPDHPWVDSADGAAVRIAMTVGSLDQGEGRLLTVTDEREGKGEGLDVSLQEQIGLLHADLRIGANVAAAQALQANSGSANRGFKLHGAGFIVTPAESERLEADAPIKPYRNGRDLTNRPRGVKLIDLFGLTAEEVRSRYPATYQWVLERVKPERDATAHTKDGAGYARLWWLHGKPRQELRKMLVGLPRFIATVETAKHRTFQFLDASIAPDNMLVCIASADAFHLGVLSSHIHVVWALAAGGRLGVGNDPRFNKSRCFEPFPFPAATPEQAARIRDLAEQLDAHRKRQQAAHESLTLTGMYNVLEKLKSGEALTAKEKAINEQGLVSVLKTLHDELDAAVLDAYGWSDLTTSLADPAQKEAASETLLVRLVALNAERAAEEARGEIRWLRPEYQHPAGEPLQSVISIDAAGRSKQDAASSDALPQIAILRAPWPAALPEQVAAVARVLAASPIPLSEADLATRFTGKGAWRKRLPQIVDTLEALGRVRRQGDVLTAAD